ncbi:hypothetical protein [Klebsiella pneumoniae]|uniref:hypothetical protein n=1 Tax=Klebsiella pneumoniae TaxID=573 RepID=UPI001CC20EA6|nr:hypothetical protein [Klebsiella pneumoniae]
MDNKTMTKSTITRERVVALIAEHSYDSALVDALEHLLAAMDSEPVALQPELAKVIYHFRDWNEGFPVERFKADYVISWMLANYPPAPPAQPAPASMEDHQIRELVNELRDISIECHGTQQLRERIARTVRAAMLNGGKS